MFFRVFLCRHVFFFGFVLDCRDFGEFCCQYHELTVFYTGVCR